MERRLATLLLLGAAVACFVPAWVGVVLSIILIVWRLVRVVGVRVGGGGIEHLVAALLGATLGLLAGSGVAYLRFGAFGASGRITFADGAWIAVVLGALLLVASFLELVAYDPRLSHRLREIRILPATDPGLD
jgi:hypothetical protein